MRKEHKPLLIIVLIMALVVIFCVDAMASPPPPKPSTNRIAKDLVGYRLTEGFENGWFHDGWTWLIKEGQVRSLKIKEVVKNTNKEYCVIVLMRLQGNVCSFNAKAKVNYVLTSKNQWEIEFVNSMGMSIVKTHKYDDCIQFSIVDDGWGGVNCLEIKNNCSIELGVAGWVYAYGEWVRFAVRVEGNKTVHAGGTFGGGNVTNYKVAIIERLEIEWN